VSSETADGFWNRLRLLLSAWSIASGGTRGSWASLASADVSQEMNIIEQIAQIFNKFITQFIHFYFHLDIVITLLMCYLIPRNSTLFLHPSCNAISIVFFL